MTRRHHPLEGQEFEVLRGGKQRITIRLADGLSHSILRTWTDADGTPVAPQGTRGSFFTVASVRRVIELIDALSSR